jgi:hypothetical protein
MIYLFRTHPIPLFKALIPFNIGSYSNFHNLLKQSIHLPFKLEQKEGIYIQVLSENELNARIPQNLKILSEDRTREIGRAKIEMILESHGDFWKGTLEISEATLLPSATDDEKVNFISAFIGNNISG